MSQKLKPVTEARIIAACKAAGIPEDKFESISRVWRKQYLPEPTVKVKALSDGWVTGYAAVFTDATKMDKTGNFMDYGRTNFMLSNYKQIPIFQTHGREGVKERVGLVTGLETRDAGLLVTRARFDLSKPLGRKSWDMALKGNLYFSGGALPDLFEVAPDGCITRFPIAELSVTRSPAGPAYKADHYSRSEVVKALNESYAIKTRRILYDHGLSAEEIEAIASILPEPYQG